MEHRLSATTWRRNLRHSVSTKNKWTLKLEHQPVIAGRLQTFLLGFGFLSVGQAAWLIPTPTAHFNVPASIRLRCLFIVLLLCTQNNVLTMKEFLDEIWSGLAAILLLTENVVLINSQ